MDIYSTGDQLVHVHAHFQRNKDFSNNNNKLLLFIIIISKIVIKCLHNRLMHLTIIKQLFCTMHYVDLQVTDTKL